MHRCRTCLTIKQKWRILKQIWGSILLKTSQQNHYINFETSSIVKAKKLGKQLKNNKNKNLCVIKNKNGDRNYFKQVSEITI